MKIYTELEIREAALRSFIEKHPRGKEAQQDLELKLMNIPEDKRLDTLFMMLGAKLKEFSDIE